MTWQFWTLITVIAFSFSLIAANYLRRRLSATILMYYQYASSLIAVILIFLLHHLSLPITHPAFILSFIIGIVNTFGAIAFMEALGFNLSKPATFFQFKTHLTILLFAVFMGEYFIFNPQTPSGLLKISALIIATLSMALLLKKNPTTKASNSSAWMKPTIIAFIIFGFSQFFAKILVIDLHPAQATVSQYLGSFLTINIIVLLKKTPLKISTKDFWLSFLRGSLVGLGWFALYSSLTTGPGSIITLIRSLGTMIIPVVFGLIFLKEHQHYNLKNYLGLILGILSIILLSS